MAKSISTRLRRKPHGPQYEDRLVLFLDFLGFRELVDRTTREPDFLKRLVAAMDLVGTLGSDNQDVFKSQKVSQFSDSIVVSYHIEERSAVFWLLNGIALLLIQLAERGFLVRGGLTVGPLYHSGRHVVGPAMNEAYRLESRVAKYPRVIIDPKVLAVARRSRNPDHTAHEEERYARDFMTEDSDGQFYFDYISWKSVVGIAGGDNDLYGDYLGRLGTLIRDGLRHDDPHVQEKYLWLRPHYVAAIEHVRGLPINDGYRKENAALCEAISRLPTYNIDAQLAEAAVNGAQNSAL